MGTRLAILIICITIASVARGQTAINAYAKVDAIAGTTLTVSSVNELYDTFEAGENLIIMQVQDDVIGTNTGNTSTFGDIGAILSAGLYEEATIQAVGEAVVTENIWVEDFEDLDEGDTGDTGLTAWSTVCGDCGGFRFFQVYQDAALGGSFLYAGHQMSSGGTWTSESISITGYSNVSISVDVAQTGFDDGSDNITVSYSLNGGGFIPIGSQSGGFAPTTISVSGLSGTTLEVRVVINSTALFDTGVFDDVTVTGDISRPTSITLESALTNSYNTGANASLQVISFPQFTDYTTASDLTAVAWDGNVGGVFAIDVVNTLTLGHNISVDQLGFRGGINDIDPTVNYNTCNPAVYRTNDVNFALKGEGIYKITDTNYERGKGHIGNGAGAPNTYNEGAAGGGNFTAGGYGSLADCASMNVVWSEDFDTGYTGGETIGANNNTANPTPDWTLVSLGGTFHVQNAAVADNGNVTGYYFYSDLVTGSTWTSEAIDISGLEDVAILIDFDNDANLDDADVMDFEYNLDLAGWVSFGTNGSLSNDGTNLGAGNGAGTAAQYGLSGTSLQIRITITVAGNDRWLFDNVRVGEIPLDENAPRGGADLSSYISASRVFMGGGGGASGDELGPGGNGGGVIFIRAATIDYNCGTPFTISANGEQGSAADEFFGGVGAAGAGAGGSIVFQVANWTGGTCPASVIEANGGDGGGMTWSSTTSGMAGGGGRGVIIFSSLIPDVTVRSNQGAQGTNPNGSTGSASPGASNPENPSAPSNGVYESSSGPLPVELLNWNAKDNNGEVLLTWVTGSETNNHFFSIEKSVNGHDWDLLATVAGAGTTSRRRYYRLVDTDPAPATNYYRLSQTDYDGTTEMFEVVSVKVALVSQGLVLYPNPTDGLFRIKMPASATQISAVLKVFDASGKRVPVEITRKPDELLVNASQLPAGYYFVRVVAGGQPTTLKLIVN